MTNEELMQLMTEMGLHEGGMENWVPDNAWLLVVNRAIEIEREACAYRASIALLGADRGLANRVIQAIRTRGDT